jgi:SAM-dependent methyltransferase
MQRLPKVRHSLGWDEENDLVQEHIRRLAADGSHLRILEAGCGQLWPLDLSGVGYTLVGVDLDASALDIRKNVRGDLHEGIHGDLVSVNLKHEEFDVIYNAFVLEHVRDADKVLENFARWLKPGGLLVLRIPDPHSLRGFLTRLTPHYVHVLYYRYVLKYKDAGKPGHGPYRTFYHPSVSRDGIYRFSRRHGLTIIEERGDETQYVGGWKTKVLISLVAVLSLGRLTHRHANLLYVLRKADGHRTSDKARVAEVSPLQSHPDFSKTAHAWTK